LLVFPDSVSGWWVYLTLTVVADFPVSGRKIFLSNPVCSREENPIAVLATWQDSSAIILLTPNRVSTELNFNFHEMLRFYVSKFKFHRINDAIQSKV